MSEFEIEVVPMPSNNKAKKGYTAAAKKLGINDNTSFFVPKGDYTDLFYLRSSVISSCKSARIKCKSAIEFKFECPKCGKYTRKKLVGRQCEECKLVDSGVRIWRIG